MRKFNLALLAGVVALIASTDALAWVPPIINYQGRLDSAGAKVPDGDYHMTFRLYDDTVGGTLLWQEDWPAVQTSGGTFQVPLGSIERLIDMDETDSLQVWFETEVNGEILAPRLQVTAVPMSLATEAVLGDVITAPGLLRVPDSTLANFEIQVRADETEATISYQHNGSTGRPPLTMKADNSGGSIAVYPYDLGMLDPVEGVELQSDAVGSSISLLSDVGDAVFNVSADGPSIVMTDYLGDTGLMVTSADIIYKDSGDLERYSRFGLAGLLMTDALGDTNLTITSADMIYRDAGGMVQFGLDGLLWENLADITHFNPDSICHNGKARIGPGSENQGLNAFAVGTFSKASGDYSVVSGGGGPNPADSNSASGLQSTVSGGVGNIASGSWAAIGGGVRNIAPAPTSYVAAGWQNVASGQNSTVSGGANNVASGWSASVAAGEENLAAGKSSFAAGYKAKAHHDGAVVISAVEGSPDTTGSGGSSQMVLRADSGLYIGTGPGTAPYTPMNRLINTSTGAHLTWGGTWTNSSDANRKENFTAIDRAALLEQLANLPITRWNYRTEGETVQHIGPTAQDFAAAFGLGSDERTISTVDPSGVALAAIQELLRMNQDLQRANADLAQQIAELRNMIESSRLER